MLVVFGMCRCRNGMKWFDGFGSEDELIFHSLHCLHVCHVSPTTCSTLSNK